MNILPQITAIDRNGFEFMSFWVRKFASGNDCDTSCAREPSAYPIQTDTKDVCAGREICLSGAPYRT
jgi:hypothetical protein